VQPVCFFAAWHSVRRIGRDHAFKAFGPSLLLEDMDKADNISGQLCISIAFLNVTTDESYIKPNPNSDPTNPVPMLLSHH
jgi:hypothetical protein